MRTTFFALLAIILGIALGIGIARLRIKAAPWNPDIDRTRAGEPAPIKQPGKPAPKVVVDQVNYAFGTLDVSSEGSHEFVFTNAGKGPLKLFSGVTSCRCTMSSLDEKAIPPGGSTKVKVTWKPKDRPGPYEQSAKILTNDPERPEITLTVSGRITATFQMIPPEIVFSRVSTTEASTAEMRLLSYLEKPIKISRFEYSNPATARYFEVAIKPLGADQLKEDQPARSGTLVAVTVKPGLPEGSFRQKIILHTDLASSPTVTLPMQGIVGGDIAVVGPGWDPDTGMLSLGTVSSRDGAQRRLMLVVRGPSRKSVTFKPVVVVPDLLKVSLGKPSEINNGAIIETPLVIEVPPGSPAVNRLGSDQGKLGEIILETTHLQVRKLRILVRLAVEK